MYTGGAVQFDASPHVQLYGKLLLKKQAEQDAFDEYIRNLNKNVNSAGLRNADRPVFDKKLADWQKFGMQNRENIRKRIGGADIKFMQDYQDLLNLVAESKTEEEKKKPLVEIMTDPNKRERLSADIIPDIAAHDEPLNIIGEDGSIIKNPNRRSFDITRLSFDPKPFETDKYFKGLEDVKRMDLPPNIVKDPKSMTQTVTTTSVFDDQAKDVIATRAVSEYMNNPSFRKVVNDLKEEDYNPVFKANYGRDIQTPADLAAAYTLKGMQQKVTTSKVEPDTFGRQQKMAALNDYYAKRRIDYRRAGNQQDQNQVLEAWIQRTFNEGKGTYNPVMIKGKFQPGRQIAVPVDFKKKYTITQRDEDGKIISTEPPRFVMTEDKKFVIPLYPGRKSDYQDPIPIETFRNELGKLWMSAKDRVGEMDEISFDNEDEVEDVTTEIISGPSGGETIKGSEVPKGASITQKDGEYYYNGKKIIM